VTSSGGRLACNTLHSAAITEEHVGVIGEHLKSGLVEDAGTMRLSTGQTYGIGEALTERAGGHLDARSIVCFRVAGSDAVDMTEMLQVVDAYAIAEHMENRILQHATVAVTIRDQLVPRRRNFLVYPSRNLLTL